jgi:heavy metal sensor kinase
MKSIRLSLTVYFLILLAVALGAVASLVYWKTVGIVQARQEAAERYIKDQFERRSTREHRKLDNALLYQARAVASLAQINFQGNRQVLSSLEPLGILTAAVSPHPEMQVPLWVVQSYKGPLATSIVRLASLEIHLDEDALPHFPDDKKADIGAPITDYYQITTEWGNIWRSESMEDLTFSFDLGLFASTRLLDWKYDNYELKPGYIVRRVTLKAPVTRIKYRNAGTPGSWKPGVPSLNPVTESSSPSFLIQCAADTTHRDGQLKGYEAERDQELAELEQESADTLTALRWQLLGIGLATFAGTFLGGFFLVRHGLAPLHRLSDAVSRVSERDFRLQYDAAKLPLELKPIVERLTQTLEQLERAFTREKQATADISHELRTPLAALLTTTEVALRKSRSAEEYRQLLEDCRGIGQQLSQQVERLLLLARLDAGVDMLRPREVDVGLIAEQCVSLVRPLADARELTLSLHRNGPARLTTDADKFREVLTNLLHNAIEYNRPAGSIDVSVARDNGSLAVEVRDTGIGIAPSARASIFQRFFRADPSRHAAGLHAGLGLAIVKGYVDLMGGAISVESTEGQGTTFRIKLPVREDEKAAK